jgi:Family of unknown function (DUF6312)
MRDLRFGDAVQRVIQLTRDESGRTTPVVLFERERDGRRKGTRLLRPFEKAVHQMARSDERRAAKYLARHERSNRKRKDGWVRDFNVNVVRAFRAGEKPLRWTRWMPF